MMKTKSEELEIDRCDDILEKLKNHYLSSIGKGTPKEESEDTENNKNKKANCQSDPY